MFFFQYNELIHFIGNCIKINIDSKFAQKSFSKFHMLQSFPQLHIKFDNEFCISIRIYFLFHPFALANGKYFLQFYFLINNISYAWIENPRMNSILYFKFNVRESFIMILSYRYLFFNLQHLHFFPNYIFCFNELEVKI